MTSELVIDQNQQSSVPATVAVGITVFRRLLDEVRSQTFSAHEDNEMAQADTLSLQEILNRNALDKDAGKRTLSAAIALLRHAHVMIESAEKTILNQENRIAQLEDLATTDELTGIQNRRGFYEAFVRELDRCERGQSAGGLLILIDLDNFKAANDTYGHLAGDAVLRLVATTLAGEIRQMDVAARLGGDEFVLLLSNTTKEDAAGRAQRLGQRLNNLALAWQGDVIPVHASLGLRAYGKGDKIEAVFNAADTQLYARKKVRSGEKRTGK